MSEIPKPTITTEKLINEYHESKKESSRGYLGLSMAGHKCDRLIWLKFRNAIEEKIPGRTLRIFRRGHREEEVIIEDLKNIGFVMENVLDDQYTVEASGHVKGHLDGIILSGVPEAPKSKHIAEFKTMNKKSFEDILKNGLEKSKPIYYVQVQTYMRLSKIDRAFFLSVCKDDDRIYTERVKLDREYADKYIDRAIRISLSEHLPEPMSDNPSWYECKWCPAHAFCFKKQNAVEINCRTCAHATPKEDGSWTCARWSESEIPKEAQREGCSSHCFHPEMVPGWEMVHEKNTEFSACYRIDGHEVLNGEDGFSSADLVAGNIDFTLESVKEVFNGIITKIDKVLE